MRTANSYDCGCHIREPGHLRRDDGFPQPVALEKLRRGEISALVCVVSKPDRWFRNIKSDENLHFLSVPANKLSKVHAS